MGEVAVSHEQATMPAWLLVSQAFPEISQEAELQTEHFLGSTAIRGEGAEVCSQDSDNSATLMTALQEAALGDPEADQLVETCVETDVAERLFKVKNVSRIVMKFIEHKLNQAGRDLTDIHRNTLENVTLNPEMLCRTGHELNNAHIFGMLHEAGLLKWFDVAVFSPTSTKMSQKEKKDYNMFLDTESCSIQWLSASGNEAAFESAFVAGKRTPGSPRHDIETIQKLTASKGAEIATDDGTDTISYVMLIPKGDTKGVVDVVKMYDEAAGGTFYGLAEPQQNYEAHAEACLERAKQFNDIVQDIKEQLIREAAALTTPLEAITRLDELSERRCIDKTVADKNLNEHVFGPRAALDIQEARFFYERGDLARAQLAIIKAKKHAVSGSCPLFKKMSEKDPLGGDELDGLIPEQRREESEQKGKKWMNCPHCKARVYDDPCVRELSCWDCMAKVKDGVILGTGDGGSEARRAQRQAWRAGSLTLMEVIKQNKDKTGAPNTGEKLDKHKLLLIS